MKVGTDGVLLGAWCAIPGGECKVADAGCGTGIISLMIAQRNPRAVITGIEIDAEAAAEATENVEFSAFASRIGIKHEDFLELNQSERFDLIVCNPPFFTESTKSPDEARAAARTEGSLSVKALMAKSAELLSENGTIALVAPTARDNGILFDAALAGFNPLRKCHVVTVAGKAPRRTLWQFSKTAQPTETSTLVITDTSGTYSEDYLNLVRDFYLNL